MRMPLLAALAALLVWGCGHADRSAQTTFRLSIRCHGIPESPPGEEDYWIRTINALHAGSFSLDTLTGHTGYPGVLWSTECDFTAREATRYGGSCGDRRFCVDFRNTRLDGDWCEIELDVKEFVGSREAATLHMKRGFRIPNTDFQLFVVGNDRRLFEVVVEPKRGYQPH